MSSSVKFVNMVTKSFSIQELALKSREKDPVRNSVQVPIARILAADSPRRAGENPEHAQSLAEVNAELPPIVVHRATLRVIDGMHRLRAARLRGQEEIAVHFLTAVKRMLSCSRSGPTSPTDCRSRSPTARRRRRVSSVRIPIGRIG